MRRYKIILILGVIVTLLPALGFPGSYDNAFNVIIGIALISTALSLIRDEFEKYSPYRTSNTDAEKQT